MRNFLFWIKREFLVTFATALVLGVFFHKSVLLVIVGLLLYLAWINTLDSNTKTKEVSDKKIKDEIKETKEYGKNFIMMMGKLIMLLTKSVLLGGEGNILSLI